MVETPSTQNQSIASTSKSKRSILIKPDNQFDIEDFITITNIKAGAKFREALSRLAQKYNFSERDYKKDRISFTVDFAAITKQEKKNSEGI